MHGISRLHELAKELAEILVPAGNAAEHDALVELVLEFAAKVRQQRDGRLSMVDRCAQTIGYPHHAAPGARLTVAQPPHPKVLLALRSIERLCIDSRLRLSDISSAVGLSPAYLDRLLKRDTALGFSDHVRQARIALAERRLLETSDPIKVIALTVGFSHVSSFDRAFVKIHGLPPTEWRAQGVMRDCATYNRRA